MHGGIQHSYDPWRELRISDCHVCRTSAVLHFQLPDASLLYMTEQHVACHARRSSVLSLQTICTPDHLASAVVQQVL